MRVTEQIDALEVMGINSLNYLVFPKIIALLFYPFVIAIAMFLGILGGWVASVYGGFSTVVTVGIARAAGAAGAARAARAARAAIVGYSQYIIIIPCFIFFSLLCCSRTMGCNFEVM